MREPKKVRLFVTRDNWEKTLKMSYQALREAPLFKTYKEVEEYARGKGDLSDERWVVHFPMVTQEGLNVSAILKEQGAEVVALLHPSLLEGRRVDADVIVSINSWMVHATLKGLFDAPSLVEAEAGAPSMEGEQIGRESLEA